MGRNSSWCSLSITLSCFLGKSRSRLSQMALQSFGGNPPSISVRRVVPNSWNRAHSNEDLRASREICDMDLNESLLRDDFKSFIGHFKGKDLLSLSLVRNSLGLAPKQIGERKGQQLSVPKKLSLHSIWLEGSRRVRARERERERGMGSLRSSKVSWRDWLT